MMMMRFSDPFERFLSLQKALEAAMSSDWFGISTSSRGAFPPLNVFKQGDDFVVIAEIPGVSKSDLDVQIKDNQLRLAGKKTIDYPEKVSVHRRERVAGEFDRTISFPAQVDADGAKAEYRDGVLTLFLPRAARDKPKSIEIG